METAQAVQARNPQFVAKEYVISPESRRIYEMLRNTEIEGVKPDSRKNSARVLAQFLEWSEDQGLILDSLDPGTPADWIGKRLEGGLSPGSVPPMMQALKTAVVLLSRLGDKTLEGRLDYTMPPAIAERVRVHEHDADVARREKHRIEKAAAKLAAQQAAAAAPKAAPVAETTVQALPAEAGPSAAAEVPAAPAQAAPAVDPALAAAAKAINGAVRAQTAAARAPARPSLRTPSGVEWAGPYVKVSFLSPGDGFTPAGTPVTYAGQLGFDQIQRFKGIEQWLLTVAGPQIVARMPAGISAITFVLDELNDKGHPTGRSETAQVSTAAITAPGAVAPPVQAFGFAPQAQAAPVGQDYFLQKMILDAEAARQNEQALRQEARAALDEVNKARLEAQANEAKRDLDALRAQIEQIQRAPPMPPPTPIAPAAPAGPDPTITALVGALVAPKGDGGIEKMLFKMQEDAIVRAEKAASEERQRRADERAEQIRRDDLAEKQRREDRDRDERRAKEERDERWRREDNEKAERIRREDLAEAHRKEELDRLRAELEDAKSQPPGDPLQTALGNINMLKEFTGGLGGSIVDKIVNNPEAFANGIATAVGAFTGAPRVQLPANANARLQQQPPAQQQQQQQQQIRQQIQQQQQGPYAPPPEAVAAVKRMEGFLGVPMHEMNVQGAVDSAVDAVKAMIVAGGVHAERGKRVLASLKASDERELLYSWALQVWAMVGLEPVRPLARVLVRIVALFHGPIFEGLAPVYGKLFPNVQYVYTPMADADKPWPDEAVPESQTVPAQAPVAAVPPANVATTEGVQAVRAPAPPALRIVSDAPSASAPEAEDDEPEETGAPEPVEYTPAPEQ